jgi:hypothetical protein
VAPTINKYPDYCGACNMHVAAMTGYAIRNQTDTKWIVYCHACFNPTGPSRGPTMHQSTNGNGGSPQASSATPRSLNLEQLIKLLKLTTSSNDHEALSASRKANLQLEKFGGDWDTLLRGKVTVLADPFASFAGEPPIAKPVDISIVKRPPAAPPRPAPYPPPPPPPPSPPKFCNHCGKSFIHAGYSISGNHSFIFCSISCRDIKFPPFKMPDRATQKKPSIKNL